MGLFSSPIESSAKFVSQMKRGISEFSVWLEFKSHLKISNNAAELLTYLRVCKHESFGCKVT